MKFRVGDCSVVLTADTNGGMSLSSLHAEADLLISEANLYEEHVGKAPGHMGGSEAGRSAGVSRCQTTNLDSLPPLHGDIEEILQQPRVHTKDQRNLRKLVSLTNYKKEGCVNSPPHFSRLLGLSRISILLL